MSTVIEFKDVSKRYGDNIVIPNFNLAIEKGEFVTIIGSSGCGKTTILKMINGLYEPSEGEIFVNGENIRYKDMIELRRSIGYAIQGSILFPHMNVSQNISYVPRLLNKKNVEKTEQAVNKWMDIVGLEHSLRDRFPDELSGGQLQRVYIAMALAQSTDIIILDEPTTFLDIKYQKSIMKLVRDLNKSLGITIIMVLHDINQALAYSDNIIALHDGKVIKNDKAENFFDEELLNKLYDADIKIEDGKVISW